MVQLHDENELMTSFMKCAILLCVVLVLSACNKPHEDTPREKALKHIWAQTIQDDTIEGYLSFLEEQKIDDDRKVGEQTPYGKQNEYRSMVARKRISQLTFEAASRCPFHSLYIDLRQNIRNVEAPFDFSSSDSVKSLKKIGVTLTNDRRESDEVLVLSLRGEAIKTEYRDYKTSKREVTLITGGTINGSLSFASYPQNQVFFSGHREPVVLMSSTYAKKEKRNEGKVFPQAMEIAIQNGNFNDQFASLIYDTCGPTAGAALYFNESRYEPNPVDQEFENRMMADIKAVRSVAIASLIEPEILFFDNRLEKTKKFLLTGAPEEQQTIATVLTNTYPYKELPSWLESKNP